MEKVMFGVLVGGVVVILVPLPSLSADQMNKMKEASQKYGTVETHHLDEFPTDDGGLKLKTLVDRINALEATTNQPSSFLHHHNSSVSNLMGIF